MTGFTPINESQRKALLGLPGSHEDSSGTIFVTTATRGRALAILRPEDASGRPCWRDRKRALYSALDRITPKPTTR